MKKELPKRILSSLIIIPIAIFFIIKGSVIFMFFLSILFLATSYEWAIMSKKNNVLKFLGIIFLFISFYTTFEFRDNVIPSSNSIMAKNLFRLYHYFDKEEYYERSKNMSLSVTQEFEAYPSGYSNWFDLIYNLKSNYYEVAVVGENALEKVKQINSKYIPNKLIIGSTCFGSFS